MDFGNISHYKFNRIMLSILGPRPDKDWDLFAACRILIAITFLCSFMLVEFFACINREGDLGKTIQALPLLLAAFFCLTKIQTSVLNRRKMRILIEEINRSWNMKLDKEELQIMNDFASKGKFYSLSYAATIYVMLTVLFLMHIQNHFLDIIMPLNETRPKRFLYMAEYFIDSEKYYIIIISHMYIVSTINMTIIVTVDSLFLLITQHACSLFAIAGYRLEHAFDQYKITPTKHNPNNALDMKKMQICCKIHQRAIKFCNLIEDTNSRAYFLQLFAMVLCLTATLLQIATSNILKLITTRDPVTIQILGFVVGQFVHLFYACFPAQQVIDRSNEIREKIYFSYWYRGSINARKMIVFILRNCNNPCKLTAGGVYVYSMQSLSMVIQTSFSYFTMMSSLQ